MDKPKYLQIKDTIKASIVNQEPNTPISSEREIATQYDVSRMTVRRAIEELVQDGYLYRDKNVGTFVADRKIRKNSGPVRSEEELHPEIEYKILYFNMYYDLKNDGKESNDIFENLEVEPGELFLRVVRLAVRGKTAICIEEVYIARKNVSDDDVLHLDEFLDFDQKLSDYRTTQVFVPMVVPPKYANLLQIKLDTPIIRVDNLICKIDGSPFIYIKSFYNPDHKRIEITM